MEECFRGCAGPREEERGGSPDVLDDSSHLPSAAAN